MKKRLLVWWMALLVGMVSLMAQQDVLDGLATAFRKGDSQILKRYMNKDVTVVFVDKGNDVAHCLNIETVMQTFFAANKVKSFDINHKGRREESAFIVGTLFTSAGSYRVNCYLKKNGDTYLIHRIRIEKTNE